MESAWLAKNLAEECEALLTMYLDMSRSPEAMVLWTDAEDYDDPGPRVGVEARSPKLAPAPSCMLGISTYRLTGAPSSKVATSLPLVGSAQVYSAYAIILHLLRQRIGKRRTPLARLDAQAGSVRTNQHPGSRRTCHFGPGPGTDDQYRLSDL